MTKKNILSVTRVLANNTEGWVPEESVNFMLSNFDLVPFSWDTGCEFEKWLDGKEISL